MKKFGKLIFTTATLAAIAGGAYYFLKNVVNKDSKDDFDDFEDDFDDFESEDEDELVEATESREYVTININDGANTATPTEEESQETAEEPTV